MRPYLTFAPYIIERIPKYLGKRRESRFFRLVRFFRNASIFILIRINHKIGVMYKLVYMNWLIWNSMVLIHIHLNHKKEIECIYHTNWYNTNWLIRSCMILIHINSSFSPTNWYNTNLLIWICMMLIHIHLCVYPTNWYNINWLIWICMILIHINSSHKKEIESWISFAWTFL